MEHHGYVVVKFYPQIKFCFPFFQTHFHKLPYPRTGIGRKNLHQRQFESQELHAQQTGRCGI